MNAFEILSNVHTRGEMSVDGVTYVVADLGPSTAAALFSTQDATTAAVANRNANERNIQKYRRDMEDGLWDYTGAPLVFDKLGFLTDGQHRLRALSGAESGTVVRFLLVLGISRDSQKSMDQGKPRTTGEQLSLLGVKNATTVASVAKHLWMREEIGEFRALQPKNVSTAQTIEVVEDLRPELEDALRYLETTRKLASSAYLLIAAHVVLSRVDKAAAEEFFIALSTGAGLEMGHPVLTLREKLVALKLDTKVDATVRRMDQLAYTYIAWNFFRAGRPLKVLRRPYGGSWTAENFPVPA